MKCQHCGTELMTGGCPNWQCPGKITATTLGKETFPDPRAQQIADLTAKLADAEKRADDMALEAVVANDQEDLALAEAARLREALTRLRDVSHHANEMDWVGEEPTPWEVADAALSNSPHAAEWIAERDRMRGELALYKPVDSAKTGGTQ